MKKYNFLLLMLLSFLLPVLSLAQVKHGYIDKTGNVVIAPFESQMAGSFSEGLAAFERDNKWGFIDKTGKVVISPRFYTVRNFKNGYCAFAEINKKNYNLSWGLIDKEGNKVVKAKYAELGDYEDGVLSFSNTRYSTYNQMGLINLQEDIIMQPQSYRSLVNIGQGLFLGEDKEYRRGIIAINGKIILPFRPEHQNIKHFNEGYSSLTIRDSAFIIDSSGSLKYADIVENIEPFNEGLAVFKYKTDTHFGYINSSGKVVMMPKFTMATSFNNGKALVMLDGKNQVIDKIGNATELPPTEDILAMAYFEWSDGLAKRKSNGGYGFVDMNGSFVIKPQFIEVYNFKDGLAGFKQEHKSSYLITQNNSNTSSTSGVTASGIQYSTADMNEFTSKQTGLLGTFIIYSDADQFSKPHPNIFQIYGPGNINEQALFAKLVLKCNSYYKYSKYSWKPNQSQSTITKGWDLRAYTTKGNYTVDGEPY